MGLAVAYPFNSIFLLLVHLIPICLLLYYGHILALRHCERFQKGRKTDFTIGKVIVSYNGHPTPTDDIHHRPAA